MPHGFEKASEEEDEEGRDYRAGSQILLLPLIKDVDDDGPHPVSAASASLLQNSRPP